MTSTCAERRGGRCGLCAWGLSFAPAAALYVLLPKCPLCIAAQLALLGIGVAVPSESRDAMIAVSLILGAALVVARIVTKKSMPLQHRLRAQAVKTGAQSAGGLDQ